MLCSTEFLKFERKIKCKLLCCSYYKKIYWRSRIFINFQSNVPRMSYPQGWRNASNIRWSVGSPTWKSRFNSRTPVEIDSILKYMYFLMVLHVRAAPISLVYSLWFFLYALTRSIALFRPSSDGFIPIWFINLKSYCVSTLNFEDIQCDIQNTIYTNSVEKIYLWEIS